MSSRIAALFAAVVVTACEADMGETCLAYACINAATLEGDIEQPEGTELVDARFCTDQLGCVDGLVDLRELDTTERCTGDNPQPYAGGVCFSRASDGRLAIRASLTRPDDGTVPPDGELYQLRVIDHDSGEVLVEEERTADYEITREDNCHVCWSAKMTF